MPFADIIKNESACQTLSLFMLNNIEKPIFKTLIGMRDMIYF